MCEGEDTSRKNATRTEVFYKNCCILLVRIIRAFYVSHIQPLTLSLVHVSPFDMQHQGIDVKKIVIKGWEMDRGRD